jgi:hypothetical protein
MMNTALNGAGQGARRPALPPGPAPDVEEPAPAEDGGAPPWPPASGAAVARRQNGGAIDPAIKTEVLRLLRDTTHSQAEIGHRFGISKAVVSNWRRDAAIERPAGAPGLPRYLRARTDSLADVAGRRRPVATADPAPPEKRIRPGPAKRRPRGEVRQTRLVARLFRAFERQVAEIEARFTDPGLRAEEKDARTLGTLARTLETLMALERDDGRTAKDPEPADRDRLNAELVRRLRRWAEGGEGPG